MAGPVDRIPLKNQQANAAGRKGTMAKEICISSTPHETRLAILEDDQLAEIYYERENEYTLAGSVYNGRVTRVLPGMQSAFVDIGLERDAFLYVTDFLELEDSEESDELEKATTSGGAQPPREVHAGERGGNRGEPRARKPAGPPAAGQATGCGCRDLRRRNRRSRGWRSRPSRRKQPTRIQRRAQSGGAAAGGGAAAAAPPTGPRRKAPLEMRLPKSLLRSRRKRRSTRMHRTQRSPKIGPRMATPQPRRRAGKPRLPLFCPASPFRSMEVRRTAHRAVPRELRLLHARPPHSSPRA